MQNAAPLYCTIKKIQRFEDRVIWRVYGRFSRTITRDYAVFYTWAGAIIFYHLQQYSQQAKIAHSSSTVLSVVVSSIATTSISNRHSQRPRSFSPEMVPQTPHGFSSMDHQEIPMRVEGLVCGLHHLSPSTALGSTLNVLVNVRMPHPSYPHPNDSHGVPLVPCVVYFWNDHPRSLQ